MGVYSGGVLYGVYSGGVLYRVVYGVYSGGVLYGVVYGGIEWWDSFLLNMAVRFFLTNSLLYGSY
jgi:hypothetical protein